MCETTSSLYSKKQESHKDEDQEDDELMEDWFDDIETTPDGSLVIICTRDDDGGQERVEIEGLGVLFDINIPDLTSAIIASSSSEEDVLSLHSNGMDSLEIADRDHVPPSPTRKTRRSFEDILSKPKLDKNRASSYQPITQQLGDDLTSALARASRASTTKEICKRENGSSLPQEHLRSRATSKVVPSCSTHSHGRSQYGDVDVVCQEV